MTVSTSRILLEILLVISLAKSEDLCLDLESTALKRLAASLGINSFTFVQDQHSVKVLQKIRGFSGGRLFSVVTNADGLEDLLSDEIRKKEFFEKRTLLVIKEEMNISRVLEKLSDLQTVSWAVFPKSSSSITTTSVPFKTNFFTLRCTSNSRITINQLSDIRPGLRHTEENIRKWKGDGRFNIRRLPHPNLGNGTLTLVSLFSEKECKERKHVLDRIECFHQDIVRLMAEMLKSRIRKIECPEKEYPYNYPNGTLSYMFNILELGQANVSSGSYIVSNNRLEFFDFVWPVFTTRSMMYIKYETVKSRWRAYLRPIENHLWSALVSWIIITGFLLQVFEESRRLSFKFSFSLIPAIIKSVFLSLQVFCNQGLHNVPHWSSTRIVFLLSFILCVALYEAYSAFLISSLMVTTPNIPFKDLDGFLSDRTYKLVTLKQGFHNYFVTKTFTEYGNDAVDLLQDVSVLPDSPKSAVDLLCNEPKLTYVEFRENINRAETSCKILELPKAIFHQSIGLGLPKNSPYKEVLNRYLTIFRSSGILHRMRTSLRSYITLHKKEKLEDDFIHVSLWHVVSIFAVVAFGVVLSIVIFLLEVCFGLANTPKTFTQKTGRRRTLKTKYLKRKYVSSDDEFKIFLRSSDSKAEGRKLS